MTRKKIFECLHRNTISYLFYGLSKMYISLLFFNRTSVCFLVRGGRSSWIHRNHLHKINFYLYSVVNSFNIQGFFLNLKPSSETRGGGEACGGGGSPRSSLSSSSALVGLMTPSTSKPAKLLTSLWIRLSCGGGGAG